MIFKKHIREYLVDFKKFIIRPKLNFDHSNKILFIHIPKTGGTSIATALYGKASSHPTLRDYYLSNKKHTNNYFKFCVVRNPYDRVISTYSHISNRPNSVSKVILKEWKKHKISSFDDFINCMDKDCSYKQLRNKIVHLRPQVEMIRYKKVKIDKIYKFENFDEIVKELNSKYQIQIKKLNTSPRTKFDIRLSERNRKVIIKRFKDDFIFFNYKY